MWSLLLTNAEEYFEKVIAKCSSPIEKITENKGPYLRLNYSSEKVFVAKNIIINRMLGIVPK